MNQTKLTTTLSLVFALLLVCACGDDTTPMDSGNALDAPADPHADLRRRLLPMSPERYPLPPPDATNNFADDPAAAELGQRLFFDPRFSGPLLDTDNDGDPNSLGVSGDTGRVACASCHVPDTAFVDSRTTRSQVSLASGWTRRKTPSLLDVGHSTLLTWSGRRDSIQSFVFEPIEKAVEMNSSRLFYAQQLQRLYRTEYEAIFGPFPDISRFDVLSAEEAGCTELPESPNGICEHPYDDAVTQIVINAGKAIGAYLRRLSCGPGRFDDWVHGDDSAMNEEEIRGAELFIGDGGCNGCHRGPLFTDFWFHNVGLPDGTAGIFIEVGNEPGAAAGIPMLLANPLNSRGGFSDDYDGRLERVEGTDPSRLLGAFRTPSLRCVDLRPTFSHTGQLRSLESAVNFFIRGGGLGGFMGESELQALVDLDREDEDALVAFLRTLTGPGPDAALLSPLD